MHNTPLNFHQYPEEKLLDQLQLGIEQAIHSISVIKKQPEISFENTLETLEFGTKEMEIVTKVFGTLYRTVSNKTLQEMAGKISELTTKFSNDLLLDEQLFKRVSSLYQKKEHYLPEQTRLIQKYYQDFVRNGALLSADDKQKLRDIDQRLGQLGVQFSENVLKSTESYKLTVTDEEDLIGLPEDFKKRACTTQEGQTVWQFGLDYPSIFPFLKNAAKEELRETMYRAYNSRATQGDFNNQKIVKEIVQLRLQKAQLLGFQNYAEYTLQNRMTKTPSTVFSFIDQLKQASKAKALAELDELKALKQQTTNSDLQPWDVAFYTEKLKKQKFDFEEEKLKPYFSLESVQKGLFQTAEKLYQLQFKPRTEKSYHDDVEIFEVSRNSQFMGFLYLDLFARQGKFGGAWIATLTDQSAQDRAHVSLVCNFPTATENRPTLLSFQEVTTWFHEFGHALHNLLSQCQYPSLAGSHTLWDFVELPSQIMENWCLEYDCLKLFAHHYQTGEVLPYSDFEKLKSMNQFAQAMAMMRQLHYASLDMSWHTLTKWDDSLDVMNFENQQTQDFHLLPTANNTNASCAFSHIFAGGYAAGYYGYKWAEVLDADAFELFQEKGIFNPEVGERFLTTILEKGNTEDPAVLFKRFRGREPQTEALLRRSGLICS